MAGRTQRTQDSLPFGDGDSKTPRVDGPTPEDAADARRGPGRPRVWASEAERKRAYRERLAADFAEPERLRRELRAERRKSAEKDREIARLKRQVDRSKAAMSAASARQDELDRMIEALEVKVEDWRSRARALAKRRDEERADRERQARPPTQGSMPKQRLELPNLRTNGRPPPLQRPPR